jgi:hypothetical protein
MSIGNRDAQVADAECALCLEERKVYSLLTHSLAYLNYLKRTTDPNDWNKLKSRDLHRSNDTRWNSSYDELFILTALREPFTEFINLERDRAIKNKSKARRIDENSVQNACIDDWDILIQYKELLAPCLIATDELQGRPGSSQTCYLSNVQNGS